MLLSCLGASLACGREVRAVGRFGCAARLEKLLGVWFMLEE